MSGQKRLSALSFALFLALLVAAVMPLSALAQDEVPPQPDAPVVVEDNPIVDEAAEPTGEGAILPEVLDRLPDNTGLVVLDEEGETLPLVSTEAAEVIAAPDPYFTVGGVTYRFFGAAGGCAAGGYAANCFDDTPTPIQDAIDHLSTTLNTAPDDGNVYVESGTYSEDVFVDGSAWTVSPASLGIIGNSGSTTLNGSFNISNMNIFTLSGFIVTYADGEAIYITNNTGALQLTDLEVTNTSVEATGIRVENHTGDVNLTDVAAFTMGTGIYIDVIDGDVTLNNVTTTGNSYGGVNVHAENGDVTVAGGNFSNNHDTGLNINASGNVALDGATATGNDSYGLGIFVASGNVNLNNVISTGNGDNGAYVNTGNGNITVNGGDFSDNLDGLDIRTDAGNITLNNVTSSWNESEGVYSWTPGAIRVNGGNFSNNGGWGLHLSSPGGTITLDNVTALANLNGARLSASDIEVVCGAYSNNDEYGLVLDGGHSSLGGPTLTGNGLGGYDLSSGTVSFGPCEKLAVDNERQDGAEDGNEPSGEPEVCNGEKKISLEPGDGFVLFQNLCGIDFQLEEAKNGSLPGAMTDDLTYITGMNVGISIGGRAVDEIPQGGKVTLKFPIPEGVDQANLAVLFWNGSTWVEVTGGRVVDGYYVIEVTQPGIHILAY